MSEKMKNKPEFKKVKRGERELLEVVKDDFKYIIRSYDKKNIEIDKYEKIDNTYKFVRSFKTTENGKIKESKDISPDKVPEDAQKYLNMLSKSRIGSFYEQLLLNYAPKVLTPEAKKLLGIVDLTNPIAETNGSKTYILEKVTDGPLKIKRLRIEEEGKNTKIYINKEILNEVEVIELKPLNKLEDGLVRDLLEGNFAIKLGDDEEKNFLKL